jgi:hypothetical protein
MKAIQAPVINIQRRKDYTAWTSYDKNNFLIINRYFIFR